MLFISIKKSKKLSVLLKRSKVLAKPSLLPMHMDLSYFTKFWKSRLFKNLGI